MADQPDTPPERATTALVLAEVRTVQAHVEAARTVTEMGLRDVQRQLDQVNVLPSQVASIRTDVDSLGRRVGSLEGDRKESRSWRATTLPTILFSAAMLVLGILSVVFR